MKSSLILALGTAAAFTLTVSAGCSSSSSGNPVTQGDAGGNDGNVQEDTGGGDTSTGGDTGADAGDLTTPITGLTDKTWTWVPFAGAVCRDGSPTGIAVNTNPGATKVMLFLEGGGACFNDFTCVRNPATFGSAEFDKWKAASHPGLMDRADAANPVKDWNMVYVPYCTGDVHAGNNPNGQSNDGARQQFVGYTNMARYLKRIVPTFASSTQVLLTGVSAGGFGTLANYEQVQKAFGAAPVDMLDDSGPPFEDPFLGACLPDQFRSLWNLDGTFIPLCGADCAGADGGISNYLTKYMKHVTTTYPNRKFGFMDSLNDGTISYFFGFDSNGCTGLTQKTEAEFTGGLNDVRTQLASSANFGTFYFTGTDHTTLSSPTYDTRTAGTTKLSDWVTAFVGGTVSHAGP